MSGTTLILVAVFCSVFLFLCASVTVCICTGRPCLMGGRDLIMARFALTAEDRRKARRETLRRKLIARFKRQAKKEKKFKSTNTLDRFVKKHQVTCPICLDRYTDRAGQEPSTPPVLAILVKCGHHFHFPCVWRWLDNNPTCPVCRRKLELAEGEIKAVTLRELHNREVDNKSDLSSVYVIDKGSLGDTMITITDTLSDTESYYSTHTNSNPRRITTRAVTVSPRSVHISPRSLSSPNSTLSSHADNHSLASNQDSPSGTHSRNGSHGTFQTHSRSSSHGTSHSNGHSRHGSQGSHSRNGSNGQKLALHGQNGNGHSRQGSHGQNSNNGHSRHGSLGEPLIFNDQLNQGDMQTSDQSLNINQVVLETDSTVTLETLAETQPVVPTLTSLEENALTEGGNNSGTTNQDNQEEELHGEENRVMTPLADDTHVVHM